MGGQSPSAVTSMVSCGIAGSLISTLSEQVRIFFFFFFKDWCG